MSAAMMLEHSFGYSQAAQWVDDAILKTLLEGYRTYDIAEPGAKVVGTSEIEDEIVRQLLSICQGKADQTCQTR